MAARTVVYYVLGFTADEQSRLQWDAAGAELPDEQSVLTDDAGKRFGFGLALLVDGIERAGSVHGGATGITRLKAPVVLDVVLPLLTARVH